MSTATGITQLTAPITILLTQLQLLLESLTDEQYRRRIRLLSNATLGQHTRHIIEFFLELNTGYQNGTVNYDERKRDYEIETSRTFAIDKLISVIALLEKEDRTLALVADYSTDVGTPATVLSNYRRELVYNLEHTVHHMALLRIGVHAVSTVVLPEDFGVAVSTMKYRNACAR